MSGSRPHNSPDVGVIRAAIDSAMIGSGGQLLAMQQLDSLVEQLETHRLALQYAIDHVESLGYTASASWLREVQEVCEGKRTWEQAGVITLVSNPAKEHP